MQQIGKAGIRAQRVKFRLELEINQQRIAFLESFFEKGESLVLFAEPEVRAGGIVGRNVLGF